MQTKSLIRRTFSKVNSLRLWAKVQNKLLLSWKQWKRRFVISVTRRICICLFIWPILLEAGDSDRTRDRLSITIIIIALSSLKDNAAHGKTKQKSQGVKKKGKDVRGRYMIYLELCHWRHERKSKDCIS